MFEDIGWFINDKILAYYLLSVPIITGLILILDSLIVLELPLLRLLPSVSIKRLMPYAMAVHGLWAFVLAVVTEYSMVDATFLWAFGGLPLALLAFAWWMFPEQEGT